MPESSSEQKENEVRLPLTLYPSKRPLISYAAASLIFLAICAGLLIVKGEPVWLWFGAFLSGAVLVGCAIQAHPRAAFLRLNQDSFTYSYLFFSKTIFWRDIKRLFLYQIHGHPYLGWHFQNTQKKKRDPPDGGLPQAYGIDQQEMLALMARVYYRSQGSDVEGN